ncbi:MAG: hypothetical protein KJN84_16650, partial [Bacteroidia bacterium]|nr:hypothetical protein [Bacteroidia bacterium]
IWVSSDQSFEIPTTWMTSPYMLNLFNPGITLKMIESGSHDTYGFGYSYSREMIDISPMTLDDLIFDLPK